MLRVCADPLKTCIHAGDQLIFGGDAEALEPAAEAAPAAERPAKRSKKTKNVEVSKATANDAAGEDTAALKAQLAALRAENQALKKRQQKPKPDAGSNGSKEEQAGPTAKAAKKSKAAKAKAAKATQAANAEDATSNGGEAEQLQEAAEAAMVDVSAWGDFELDPAIEGSLARMGFAAPTHIQAECISAAVRDRRDIIGAAQTASFFLFFFFFFFFSCSLGGRMLGCSLVSSSTCMPQTSNTNHWLSHGCVAHLCAGLWQDAGLWLAHLADPHG